MTSDQALLEHALLGLEAGGAIEYTGEFGAEIATFVPFALWLKREGRLAGRRVITYRGMRPYYYFLGDDEFEEKAGPRAWLPVEDRGWPSRSTYSATRQAWHAMPDYRSRYAGQGMEFDRSVLFIQNKFTVEWGRGPINYLPLDPLARLFELTAERFDIVYSRPRSLGTDVGYSSDHNSHCDYPDLEIARRFKHVRILEDLCAATGDDYNQTKLEILAKSHLFVAAQGGGAHLLACFGDSLLLLLHLQGEEYPHAYAAGPYKYLAANPPILLLARDHDQFVLGVELMGAVQVEGKGLKIGAGWRAIHDELRI
jgi:hypothetical protein